MYPGGGCPELRRDLRPIETPEPQPEDLEVLAREGPQQRFCFLGCVPGRSGIGRIRTRCPKQVLGGLQALAISPMAAAGLVRREPRDRGRERDQMLIADALGQPSRGSEHIGPPDGGRQHILGIARRRAGAGELTPDPRNKQRTVAKQPLRHPGSVRSAVSILLDRVF